MTEQPFTQVSDTEPDFVHTAGMDCPCGPERVPIGIGHKGQPGVNLLVDDGTD